MNAAIRAVVRSACAKNIEVTGIVRGYEGLVNGTVIPLTHRSVSGIINLGGTILKTARSGVFRTEAGQQKALRTIRDNRLEGLIVIGGNGSLSGAHLLSSRYGVPIVGIAATIDNDVNGVDMTLGADTAVNVALDALDKIRDTATSLERVFVVEVMGRDFGWIALEVALAGGCEEVLIPEKSYDITGICEDITESNIKGKLSWIIIVAEGKADARDVAGKITDMTGLETRVTVLGHLQRGGRPTRMDRILGALLGNEAVEKMSRGETGVYLGLKDNKMFSYPLAEAVNPKHIDVDKLYKLVKIFT